MGADLNDVGLLVKASMGQASATQRTCCQRFARHKIQCLKPAAARKWAPRWAHAVQRRAPLGEGDHGLRAIGLVNGGCGQRPARHSLSSLSRQPLADGHLAGGAGLYDGQLSTNATMAHATPDSLRQEAADRALDSSSPASWLPALADGDIAVGELRERDQGARASWLWACGSTACCPLCTRPWPARC